MAISLLIALCSTEGFLWRGPAEERGGAAYRLWIASTTGTVREERAGVPGTDVRVTGDLDVDQNQLFHDLVGWVRLENVGYIRGELWFGRFEGSETLDSTITFGGSSFSAGSRVDSEVSALVFGATFEYPAWRGAGEVVLQGGLRYVSVSTELESPGLSERGSLQGLIPVIGARAWYEFAPFVRGEAELNGLVFAASGRRLRLLDFRIEVVATHERFFGGLGFRVIDVFTREDAGGDESETDLTLSGFYVTGGVRW